MERYYYHGIECFLDAEATCFDQIIEIIKSGAIKTPNDLNKNVESGLNHICLFKKNEEVDYESRTMENMSALDAWIGNGLVFVISPEIKAYKPIFKEKYNRANNETNIFDEWRTDESIPLEKIVGLAFPLDFIKESIEEDPELGRTIKEKLDIIIKLASEYRWFIENSDIPNFTDNLDNKLNTDKMKLNQGG